MIFADLDYDGDYGSHHDELLAHLRKTFKHVQAGHQGDSWIWVLDGAERVAVDTFSSMKHQVKSGKAGIHVEAVINALLPKYKLRIYEEPEVEAHEDIA